MISFSIIIPTYNPQVEIFQRLLDAILQFEISSPKHEVIIVDNNSNPSLSYREEVNSFVAAKENARIILEPIPGLTSARIAGIKAAIYDWIIFFDDDNEPDKLYLMNTAEFLIQNPRIGIAGPGIVNVEFLNSRKYNNEPSVRKLFQERRTEKDLIGSNLFTDDADSFPYGTGMILNKRIALSYVSMVAAKLLTANDRTSTSLSSAGDSQILYLAIKQGFRSGTSPKIMLNHLIGSKKNTLKYMVRLIYALEAGHIKSYNQVFTELPLKCGTIDGKSILRRILPIRKIIFSKQKLDLYFSVSSSLGKAKAAYVALEQRTHILLKFWEKLIGIK